MSETSPGAQALIDRLTAMDPADPRHDTPTIERAITAHLVALGLPARPCVWAPDAAAGSRLVLTAAAWDAARDRARDDTLHEAWNATRGTGWDAARDAARAAAQDAAHAAAWYAARAAAWRGTPPQADEAYDAAWAAVCGIGHLAGRAAFDHPATAKLVSFWLPLVDAFEAGLFLYWVTPREVICVLQPTLSIENGCLHRADGPAVAWSSGEVYFFWRGVEVPAWIIEEQHKITVEAVRDEPNQEIRRCMTEIYGLSRYFKDAGARLVHQDEYGKLWEAQVGEEMWRSVEVENGTLEPDGSRRTYTLEVTGAAEVLGWPIETARAAVAATYGLREEEYCPEVRT